MNVIAGTLNNLGVWLFKNLLQMSLELLILAVVVMLVILVFRIKSPTLRHLFCCLILAKPVVTFLIASPISLYWFLHPAPRPEPEPIPITRHVQAPVIPRSSPVTTSFHPRIRRDRTISAPAPEPSFMELIDANGICAIIWLTVSSILCFRFIAGFIYLLMIRRRAIIQTHGRLFDILESTAKEIKTFPQTHIAITADNCGPVVAGNIRPLILMPEKLAEHLSTHQLRLIIAHELIHVKRKDNLVLIIQRLAEIFLFFHPVVWICGRIMRNDAEAACDNAVLSLYGNSNDYAESLLRVAESRNNLPKRLLVNTFAAAESDFKKRVKRIAGGKPVKMTVGLTIFSVITMVVIGCLGLPGSTERKLDKNKKDNKEKRSNRDMKKNVEKIDGKTLISKFPSCAMDNYPASMLQGLKLILEYYGEKPSIGELMVYSGDAFNLCHATNWELRTALSIPTDTMANAVSAYGFKGKWTGPEFCWTFNKMSKQEKQEKGEKFIAAMLSEIKNGRPVLYGGANGQCGNWRVLTGYDKEEDNVLLAGYGPELKWLPLHDPKVKKIGFWDAQVRGTVRGGFYGGWLANAAFIPGKPGKKPEYKKSAKAALKQAVEIFNAPAFSTKAYGDVTYSFGQEAYLKMAINLQSLDYPATVRREEADGNPYGFYDMSNLSWQINQIIAGRTAAAEFCIKAAEAFPESARNLKTAATAYRQEVALAQKFFKPFIKTKKFNPGDEQWRDAILYADAKKFLSSPTKRKAGAEAIRQMLEYEQKAVEEISRMLKAEGVEIKLANGQSFNDNQPAELDGVKLINMPAPSKERGNTYARGMSSVLSYLGKDISYEQVMGLTGVAFILQLDTSGPYINGKLDCAWWPNDAWGFNLGLPVLSKAAGWEFKQLRSDFETYQADAAGTYQKNIAPAVTKSLKAGRPVLAEYDHCFIVTGSDEGKPPLLGYGTRGASTQFNDILRMSAYPWAAIVFDKKITPDKQKDIDIASLSHIVALFDDQVPTNSPTRFSGKKAWQEWIKLLKGDGKKGDACDNNMLIHMRYKRSCAVAYLKEMAKRYSGKTAEQINTAAKLYEQGLDKLNKQGLPWNLVKSGKPAKEVLAEYTAMVESAFELETQAIDHLRKALELEGVKVKKVKTIDKKIITDVPVISWGNPGSCSFAAALEAAFKVTKHPYSYNEIMGDSALAFRVRWRGLKCKKGGPWWCGSIPVAEFPDVTARISDQTGWKFKSTGMLEAQPEKIRDYIPEVIESINKGLPVVGYPTGKQLDCATIYGYEIKDGKIFFYWRNLYTGAKNNIAPADNTGPWLLFLESWKKAPSAKKRFINALKQSVINWYRAPSGNPDYYTWSYGKEALEIWIDDLKKVEKYTEKERGELFFVNAWNFQTIRDARNNAVKYLEANIKLLPEKAAKKLKKALKLYKEETKLFKANPDAFKGPMNGKKLADWTEKNIKKELKILEKALKLENSAIQLIEKYLKSIDVEAKTERPTGNNREKAPGAKKNRN